MSASTLSAETISLIHHVELNKVGWWDTAQQAMILSAARDLCLQGHPPPADAIAERLAAAFSLSLSGSRLNSHLTSLVRAKSLIQVADTFKVSEAALGELERNFRQTCAIAEAAQARFAETLQARCPDIDSAEVWPLFNEQFLTPLVHRIGVNTYRLISGLEVFDYRTELGPFLQNFPSELHSAVKGTIEAFLDPAHTGVRSYVLGLLNAHFVVEASGLSDNDLQSLGKAFSGAPSFNLFLDTNFLFSILGLHENPSNEAAVLLADLIRQVSDKVSIKPYVLPCTIDEAKRVIEVTARRLTGVRLTPNLAEAAVESGVSGMVERFAEESRKVKGGLRADDYFEPYLRNLVQVVRTRGVELFNEDLDHLKRRQDFIDDLNSLLEHEKNRHATKPKGYEQVEHDLLLWYFVRSKRPALVESPLDSHHWVVTVDFRFLAFDSFKRRASKGTVPICVHPTTLTLMLQFWVPRSAEFEKAMLGMMRLPFLFPEFDLKAEQVTIRILDALSRFEKVHDLPVATINAVLTNEALRTKMESVKEIQEAVKLVGDALIAENRRWRHQFEQVERDARSLRAELTAERSAARSARELASGSSEELKATRDELAQVRSQVNALSSRLAETDLREALHREWNRYSRQAVIIPGSVAAAIIAATWILRSRLFGIHHADALAAAITSTLLFLWVWFLERVGQRTQMVRESRAFRTISRAKKWLMTLLGILATGAIGNASYDLLRRLF